jgi:hypothetical protein
MKYVTHQDLKKYSTKEHVEVKFGKFDSHMTTVVNEIFDMREKKWKKSSRRMFKLQLIVLILVIGIALKIWFGL